MRKFSKVICLVMYVATLTWLNLQRVDPELLDALGGGGGGGLVILIVLLALMYGAIAICTVWIVGALSRFTYKIAAGGVEESVIPANAIQWLVIVALLSRIPAVLVQHFAHNDLGIAVFIIPVVLGVMWIIRDSALIGARKILAFLPILGYIVVDTVILLNSRS